MVGLLVLVVLCAGGGVALWPAVVGYFTRGSLERLRGRYGGQLTGPNLLKSGLVLDFSHRDTRAIMEVVPHRAWRRLPVVMVRQIFRPAVRRLTPLRLEAHARSRQTVAPKGLAELTTGDGELDEALLVSGDPADMLRLLLAEGLRARLAELLALSTNLDVFHVSFTPDRLIIERSVEVRWDMDWVDWVFPLMDRVGWGMLETLTGNLAENEAPALMELSIVSSPERTDEAPECLVCAQRITTGRQAFCTACETPHHLDCWLYNERCALFGCGGERYRERVLVVGPETPE